MRHDIDYPSNINNHPNHMSYRNQFQLILNASQFLTAIKQVLSHLLARPSKYFHEQLISHFIWFEFCGNFFFSVKSIVFKFLQTFLRHSQFKVPEIERNVREEETEELPYELLMIINKLLFSLNGLITWQRAVGTEN